MTLDAATRAEIREGVEVGLYDDPGILACLDLLEQLAGLVRVQQARRAGLIKRAEQALVEAGAALARAGWEEAP